LETDGYLEKSFVFAGEDVEKYLSIVNEMLELTRRLLS